MSGQKYTDQTPMPFGKHKGTRMIDVPDSYLLWLHDQNIATGHLKAYLDDNIEQIKANAKRGAGR